MVDIRISVISVVLHIEAVVHKQCGMSQLCGH